MSATSKHRRVAGWRGRQTERHPARNGLAGLLVAVISLCGGLATAIASVTIVRERIAPRPLPVVAQVVPKYLVLLVLDGARPDYFGLTPLPNVDALRAGGTQFTNAMDGILEAETPAGHTTIATGSRPNHSGILGFDWMNDNDRYSLFSPDKMTSLEQIISDAHAPTLAGLYKAKYPTASVVALSGHKYYAAAPLGGPSADAIMYYQGDPQGRYVPVAVPGHVPPAGVLNAPGLVYPTTHTPDGMEDHLATKLALAAVSTMKPRMLLINYPEFDWPLGHVDGGSTDRARVITDMKAFDADLGSLEAAYRKAGILGQTLFVITADHGMMPITRWIPSTVVSNAVTAAGTSAPNIASDTADYVWLTDATKAQAVAGNIVAAHNADIQSTYYLSTAGGSPHYVSADPTGVTPAVEAANQYLLAALLNGHQPTVVVFGREGATFSDPKTTWKADHGGNSWESQHMPLIMAGPGIQAGKVTGVAAQLDDIAPTVLADMGVAPTGMDGRVLTDALLQPSSAATAARATEVAQISPLLTALASQSKSDLIRK